MEEVFGEAVEEEAVIDYALDLEEDNLPSDDDNDEDDEFDTEKDDTIRIPD